MLKILATSDWHADFSTSGVDRYDEIRAAALQTVQTAIEERVSLYAFLGDLANPDDGPRALRAVGLMLEVEYRLRAAGIPMVALAGNHDVIEDGSGRTTLSPLRNVCHGFVAEGAPALYGIDVPEDSGVQNFEDELGNRTRAFVLTVPLLVLAIPYPPATVPVDVPERVRALVGGIKGKSRGIVLAHCTHVEGARQGEETLEMPRGRSVPLPLGDLPEGWPVVCGHFHTPQYVEASRVYVPGALARLTFGEESNNPRYLILDI